MNVFSSPSAALKSLVIMLSVPFLLGACAKDPVSTVDCSGLTPTYTNEVKLIVNTNCAISGCHNAVSQQAGFDFSTYEGVKNASETDRFLGAIQHKGGYRPMPENAPKLSQDNIDLVTCWVQNGAPL